jgi:hypothetical protein
VTAQAYHLAQINIGRMNAPLTDPIMADFVNNLEPINALADGSPGFVWRLQTEAGNATAISAYDDPMIIINMSVWESAEALKAYVYHSPHIDYLRRRKEWFEKFDGVYLALWWISAGHLPTIAEAKERLDYLAQHGDTPQAFSFRNIFPQPTVVSAG